MRSGGNKMKRIVVIIVLLAMSACSNTHKSHLDAGPIVIGTVGALIGGVTAGQFGSGTGQLIFTALGATIGGGVGYSIGKQLIPSDISRFNDSALLAMEDTADGQLFSWTNPTTGVAGPIKPTRTFYAGEDIYCREFEARIAVNEAIGTTTSRACRIAGGAWYLAPNA